MKIHSIAKLFILVAGLIFASQVTIANPAVGFQAGGIKGISDLGNDVGLGGGEDEILEPDVAFQFNAELVDANTLKATWQIADKHYLYRDKFKFNLKEGDGVTLGQANLPPGETKDDEFFGRIQVFHNKAEATIPLNRTNSDATTIKVQFVYQGCAEETGICYPPQRKTVSFDLPAGGITGSVAPATPSASTENLSETDQSSAILMQGDVIEILIYFFLGGLALAFTACMYPMIPILSSIIVGHGENINRAKAFTISGSYVTSMAVTFGIMGAAVALFAGGINLQAHFQSPWVLIPFAFLFVALAMSMFGFYEIQMPSSVQGWLSNFSNKQEGGTLHGAIFMGAASALIIGPCAGPVIIGALAYAAKEGDWIMGFLSMFIMGLGLGLPLLIVGTVGGHVLPKAGTWMDTVKAAAGIILLAIAVLFLERISFISPVAIMLLWATLFIVVGVYMGALDAIKEGASGWFKLWKGIGVVFIVYGVIVMLGGVTGARNFNDPLHGSAFMMGGGGSYAETTKLNFKTVKSVDELKSEVAKANASGKYVMLDFYADWCTYCKTMEDYVFTDSEVRQLLKNFVLLKVDLTETTDANTALMKHTGAIAPPTIMFYDKNGKEVRSQRLVGNMSANQLSDALNAVLNK